MKTDLKKVLTTPGLLAAGFALILAGCVTTQTTEDHLAAAGFKLKMAETPEQLETLKNLPQHELTPQQRHGQTFWIYADADSERLYVGTEAQHSYYQQAKADQEIAQQDQMTAETELMMQTRQDAMMGPVGAYNWGAWGPWGY